MDSIFKNFYTTMYQRTNGFIPVFPLNNNVHPGDFFQLHKGEMIFLGNIFNPQIVNKDEVLFEQDIQLNPANWSVNSGISKPYSGRGSAHNGRDGEIEFSKQIISFDKRGSFIFKGSNPQSVRIANWKDIQRELIIKLTQTYYSFRAVYVVTETALLDDWTLAIAGAENAELEIATEATSYGLVDIFGDNSAKTIQSRDLEFYDRSKNRHSCFFKAKKLIVNDDQIEVFITDYLRRKSEHQTWAKSFYPYDFHQEDDHFSDANVFQAKASVLDLLQGNQLNPNTALSYFSWTNTDMDDIETLFRGYA